MHTSTGNYKRETVALQQYVFIIDEINRGELSKIFGELFFSIDPGYRGEKGRVATQYQNLVENADAFEDGFYIPENVYIIGTMNDIDRSVESMDFAIRRRFTWYEVTASESADNMGLKDDAKNRMERVNKKLKELGFSEAYSVGGAYFMDLNEEKSSADFLWEHRLKGLLFEYLRGMDKAEYKLGELKNAYYGRKAENNNRAE